MSIEFEGHVAVVTGAASGIGRAMAGRFAELGMRVVLADIETGPLRAAASELEHAGHSVLAVPTDVSRPEALRALADRTLDAFGFVHLLCNNAGVFAGGASWETPLEDYEWVFGVNVRGVLHGLRAFVPIFLRQATPAHIVNTASMAGLTGAPFAAPYYLSKHAVVCLSETLYLEMKARGAPLGVSVLCPELVATSIGSSERNRPDELARDADQPASPERDLVEVAIREAVKTGCDPAVMAERVVAAVREDRFYVMPEEENAWRQACLTRLEDIRLGRNPTPAVPND